MSSRKKKRARLIITSLVFVLLAIGTTIAIFFARGYRLDFNSKNKTPLAGTGLLSATSYPKSAQVYIDNELRTATEDTINLSPGQYNVRITKEGFTTWEKNVTIRAELVTSTDARLFPAVPSLSAATYNGVTSPMPSPDGKKVAFITTTGSSTDLPGLYLLDLNSSLLGLNRTPTLIATSTPFYDLADATLVWSPDSKQILVLFTRDPGTDLPPTITNAFLLDASSNNPLATLPDVTIRLPLIFSEWEVELRRTQEDALEEFPEQVQKIVLTSNNVFFSPEGEKVLYSPSIGASLQDDLITKPASINSTQQDRQLKPNNFYVYDSKEDTNYNLNLEPQELASNILPEEATPSASPTFLSDMHPTKVVTFLRSHYSALFTGSPQWYPTSRHLITTMDNRITITEYDAGNPITIYSGPFDPSLVYPSPNGNSLIILTNLNQDDSPQNLYTLDLK